jgi:predicted dehydrogenase
MQLDEALRSTKADAAVITSAPTVRAGQALQALEAGMAVAIEQPLALSLMHAVELVQASRRSAQPIMVVQTSPQTRCEVTIRQLVQAGKVGTISHVSHIDRHSCQAQEQGALPPDYAQLLHVGASHLNKLQRLLAANPVRVMARCRRTPLGPCQHGSQTEVLLEMEHNAHVQYYGSLTANRREQTLWIEGDRGVLWSDFSRLWWRKRGWRFFLPLSLYEIVAARRGQSSRPYASAWLDHFRQAVIDRRPPPTSAEDNLWTVAMLEAVMLSDRTGTVARIDDLFHAAGMAQAALPGARTGGGS